ncbi:uncharacterized protein LOC133192588 [Saccostrea echinata]|uniref:uncharacterized protein LOC133192588 n=1 Tax=Saccostrea echinata TaxID=191078 RepID=UPI002A7ED773|nr:uncharacterized protein LOC133192588 [Saccostrea echinata]
MDSSSAIEFGAVMKKDCFHFEEGVTFINHGSYGAVPLKIREKQKQLLDEVNDNPDEFYRLKEHDLYMRARDAAAKFTGADPENLFFVQNTTTGVNSVLKSLQWQNGDGILTNVFTFRGVANTCRRVTEISSCVQIHQFDIKLPIKDEQEVVKSMTVQLDKHPQVRLVLLDHITSHTALVFPLKKMIEECRKRDVLVLIDGAHAPGQVELNLEDLHPDFYTGNFHKWLYAPRGCAVLWISKDHHDWCTPLVTSLMYRKNIQLEYFDQGTRDNIPYFLVPDVLDFYKQIGGMEKIHQYTGPLLEKACSMITERLGTTTPEIPKSMAAPNMRLILLPEYRDYTAETEVSRVMFKDIMTKYRINCAIFPAHGHLYLRLSANIYNELSDYVKIADVLENLPRR